MINQSEIDRYLLIAALTRCKKPPAKILHDKEALQAWAKAAKLDITAKDALAVINNTPLSSENYTLSNDNTITQGYKKIGIFTITIPVPLHGNKHPTWLQIIKACPQEYVKEGIGLWPDLTSAQRTTVENDQSTLAIDVWVYYRPLLFSKKGMQAASKKDIEAMFHKGEAYWMQPEMRKNAWFFIEREYYKRFDYWSTNYQKYLDAKTVGKNAGKLFVDTKARHGKEKYLKELKELKHDMEKDPAKYWKYHHIDK